MCVWEVLFFQATNRTKACKFKKEQQRQKREELGLTIKIEVDGCLAPAVYKNMYRETDHTIYKEHN